MSHRPDTTRFALLRPGHALPLVGVVFLLLIVASTSVAPSGNTSLDHGISAAASAVSIGLGQTAVLAVPASAVAPGDTVQRIVDLTNTGTGDLASLALTTTSSTTTLLTQNPPPSGSYIGMSVVIDKCPSAWTKAATNYQFSCPDGTGAITTVVANRPILFSNLSLGMISALHHGSTDHLRTTITLPTLAGNPFQGLSSSINYAFTGSSDPSQPECAGKTYSSTLVGTNGNDTLTGPNGNTNDVIFGLDGNDTISSQNGSDCIVDGNGNNTVTGPLGSTILVGTGTNSITIGNGSGVTAIYTGGRTTGGAPALSAATRINAGNGGNSTLNVFGGNGNDTIYLATGSGTIDGGGGTNVCHVPKSNKVNYTITNCTVVSP